MTADDVTFTNLDVPSITNDDGVTGHTESDLIPQDSKAIYYVVADVNSIPDDAIIIHALPPTNVYMYVSADGSSIVGSHGETVPMNQGMDKVLGNHHQVAQNTFNVVPELPTNKNLATDAMEFTVYAYGKDKVTLHSATFQNVLTGYSGGLLTIVRKSDNAIVGTGDGTTGTVKFKEGTTVESGTSSRYIVKLTGAVLSSRMSGWSIRLMDLAFDGLDSAAHYSNNAVHFPFVSEVTY
jgi:hypothetical protein